MKECDVRKRAFAMPLTSPAYPINQSKDLHTWHE
jgi:acetoacetate decarboxylase